MAYQRLDRIGKVIPLTTTTTTGNNTMLYVAGAALLGILLFWRKK